MRKSHGESHHKSTHSSVSVIIVTRKGLKKQPQQSGHKKPYTWFGRTAANDGRTHEDVQQDWSAATSGFFVEWVLARRRWFGTGLAMGGNGDALASRYNLMKSPLHVAKLLVAGGWWSLQGMFSALRRLSVHTGRRVVVLDGWRRKYYYYSNLSQQRSALRCIPWNKWVGGCRLVSYPTIRLNANDIRTPTIWW